MSGSSGPGGSAGAEPSLCAEGQVCQPAAPDGWLGPVAYWEGEAGSTLPECPEGYENPTDLHAEPSGDPLECECTCSPTPQKCGTTDDITLFSDLDCNNACAHAGSQACTAISGCSGASLSIFAPVSQPAGSCEAKVSEGVKSTAAWQRDARFCDVVGTEDECGDQSCFPTPTAPFASQLCVYRVVRDGQRAPACPEEYPDGPELLYTTFVDERTCGECECTGLIGGACKGEVTIGNTPSCTVPEDTYTLGEPCAVVQSPEFVAVEYALTPGTCGVESEPEALGDVVPSGNFHAVCCR